MTNFVYVTQDNRLAFEDTGSWISIWRNGKEWGVPQGDWALRALIDDLIKLKEENIKLKSIQGIGAYTEAIFIGEDKQK